MTERFRIVRLRTALLLSAMVIRAVSLQAATPDVNSLPKPTGYVSDLAHVVNTSDKATLEEFCTQVDQQLGVQLAIVTIGTVGDTPIEDFALDLFRHWGIGSKKDNSGVLLLLAIQDHKSRLQTGRGVEAYLTDGFSGSTLRSMRPSLRTGNYGAALIEGAREMAAEIAQGKGVAFDESRLPPRPARRESGRGSSGLSLHQIIFGIFVVFFVLSLFRRGGGGGGYRGGGGGFWTGFLLSSLLNSGGGRRDGGWGGGGFGGGSDGGGGGGFGGFGGGDSGGGGASSNW